MRLLIIGANGQLGWELGKRGHQKGFDTVCVDLPEFNITDQAQVLDQVKMSAPNMVINASAYTAVDKAESESELAFAVNEKGPSYLADACAAHGIPMVHVSTDYVFSGDKDSSYLETDSISPMGVYGQSKADGENAVRRRLKSHIIIRTAWLYGVNGRNFVKTMLKLGKDRETIRVVADQHGCPTYAGDLADAIIAISGQVGSGLKGKWGTYHYCGKGHTTWHGFAEAIFEMAKSLVSLKVQHVEPISTGAYPTPAKRPANSVLDCSRIQTEFGIRNRPWKESLAEMLKILLDD